MGDHVMFFFFLKEVFGDMPEWSGDAGGGGLCVENLYMYLERKTGRSTWFCYRFALPISLSPFLYKEVCVCILYRMVLSSQELTKLWSLHFYL